VIEGLGLGATCRRTAALPAPIWFGVEDLGSMVYGMSPMVYGLLYGIWFLVYGLWYLVYGIWLLVYG